MGDEYNEISNLAFQVMHGNRAVSYDDIFQMYLARQPEIDAKDAEIARLREALELIAIIMGESGASEGSIYKIATKALEGKVNE